MPFKILRKFTAVQVVSRNRMNYAEIDRIEYMFKRRDDSRVVTRQILDRIEERIESSSDTNPQDLDTNSPYLDTNLPNLTVIAHPVFPYRPLISTGDIYEFSSNNRFLRGSYSSDSMSRVTGGFFTRTLARIDGASRTYRELNRIWDCIPEVCIT